jgi:L-rhamnose mutarotase
MAVGGDSATSTTAKTQLTLFVTIHVSPENIEKFKEAHRPVWAQCAREDECLLFDVFQDTECPERFRFVELWSRDREWFEKVNWFEEAIQFGSCSRGMISV